MGAALEGALRILLQFLISCRDMFFSLKRGVGDSSYTSFSSSSLVGTMSADTLIVCPLDCLSSTVEYVSQRYQIRYLAENAEGRFDDFIY